MRDEDAPRPRRKRHEEHDIHADDPLFDADVPDFLSCAWCFTGHFAYGARPDCQEAVARLGADVIKEPLANVPCCLVVGSRSNAEWSTAGAGRKILRASSYREKGFPVRIIHEDAWAEALLLAEATKNS